MTFATRCVGAVLITLMATACAGSREAVLDSSGSKPGWVSSDQDSWEEDDKLYFRALVDRQLRLDLAVERARAAAKAEVGKAVTSKVMSVFGESFDGTSNDVDNLSAQQEGGNVRRELFSVSKAANLQGVTPVSSYWEKVRTTSRSGEETIAYKVYAVVYIPKKMFQRAQEAAVQEGLKRTNAQLNQERRESVTRALEQLKNED
jgi:hypothetical protein